MSTIFMTEQKLFGLFELDPTGTVIYSRIEGDGNRLETIPDFSGHNFYEEVAPFSNVEEFRLRVHQFTRGATAADNFNFDCRYGDEVTPVRVLLARIRERSSSECTKSVLVHIRKGL